MRRPAADRRDLHPEPVPLRALELVGELEAVHLQQVEESVSHHVRYAVVRLRQAAVEPAGENFIS